MPRIRTSRRVPPLKDSDYDHEISLVDDDASDSDSHTSVHDQASASVPDTLEPHADFQQESQPHVQQEAHPPISGLEAEIEAESAASVSPQVSGVASSTVPILNTIPPTPATATDDPGVASNVVNRSPSKRSRRHSKRASNASRDSANSSIDILYESERGGILCGIPLFSFKALGNFDPAPWTNAGHKPSLTSTKTATVPDPSWEWAWPEWKVNRGDGGDKDGWEYSFMFSKRFCWHGPKWWNSFVRRRAWIRRRVRRCHSDDGDAQSSENPGLLNTDYFTVHPAAESTRSYSSSIASRVSRMSSMRGSRASFEQSQNGPISTVSNVEETPDIVDSEMLLAVLTCSRIDREKIEAVENYLQHDGDGLVHLQEAMHDIMSLFIFQSSRRILLTRLMQIYEETKARQKKDDSPELEMRVNHLSAAIKHADEEVQKLEYWSDIKGVAEHGGPVDNGKGSEKKLDNGKAKKPRDKKSR